MPSAIRKPIPRATLRDELYGDEQRKPLVAPAKNAASSKCRRKLVDPAPCEPDHDDTELEPMQDDKQRSRCMFPTWSEVLEVLHSLECRKPADSQQR